MKIRASYKLSTLLILGVGTIGFSIFTYFSFIPILSHEYLQIPQLLLTTIAGFFMLASLYYLLKMEVVYIDQDKLTIKSFYGLFVKEFQLQDLQYYTGIRKNSKYLSWEDFDLVFPNGKVRISSSNFSSSQYEALKNAITPYAKNNKDEEEEQGNRQLKFLGIFFIIIWSLLAYVMINQDEQGNKSIEEFNTESIEGVIVSDVRIKRNSRGGRRLEIRLEPFPSFLFKLKSTELKALKEMEFINDVRKGNQIELKIRKDVYEKKILKFKALSFKDKHFNYHSIRIYGISQSGKNYLPMDELNEVRANFHTKGNYYGFMALAFFGIGLGIYLLFLSRMP